MRISPTESAAALFTLSLLLGAAGVLLDVEPLAAAAALLWLLLGAAFAHAARLGRLARRERLAFSWREAPRSRAVQAVAEAPVTLLAEFRHDGPFARTLRRLRAVGPETLRVEGPETLHVPPGRAVRFELRATPLSAGRHRLLGLGARLVGPLGLFEVPLYFPFPLRVVAAPRPWPLPERGAGRSSTRTAGQSRRQVRGSGLELHELRDLVPGDPFHAIAWKPSARLGRWIVREVEREVQRTRWILLDASGTMRGAGPGRRKLDAALGMARTAAERWLRDGDRVGLAVLDGRPLHRVPPDDRAGQLRRLQAALLDSVQAVDEDLTALDDEAVARLVLRHVRLHDGLSPARRPVPQAGAGLLSAAAEVAARAEPDAVEQARRVRATSREGRLLRAFCRVRGLPLPWRPDPRDGAKGRAFAEALERLARSRPAPDHVLLLTDADGMEPFEPLQAPLRALRRRGTLVEVVLLPPLHWDEARQGLAGTLRTIYELDEQRRLRDALRRFARAGARPLAVPLPGGRGLPEAA